MTVEIKNAVMLGLAVAKYPPSMERIEALLHGGRVDWAHFVAVIKRHRVQALAHNALRRVARQSMPETVLATLTSMAERLARQSLGVAVEAVRLDRAMAKEGIQMAALKGPVLGAQLYGNIALRPGRDLDVLVDPGKVDAAVSILGNQGYRRVDPPPGLRDHTVSIWRRYDHHLTFCHPDRGIVVELHWRLARNPSLIAAVPESRFVRVTLGGDGVSGRLTVATLQEHDHYLYVFAHGAGHGWERLKWLSDVTALAAKLGADGLSDLVRSAHGKGLIRPVATGLLLAREMLGLDVPQAVLACLPRGAAMERLLSIGREAILFGDGAGEIFDWPERTRRLYLARFLLRRDISYHLDSIRLAAISFEDLQERDLPRGSHFLYIALRLPFWLARRRRRKAEAHARLEA